MLSAKHGDGMAKGLYRDTDDDWAMVDYGPHRAPVPRSMYDANGYEPPYNQLPFKDRWEEPSA